MYCGRCGSELEINERWNGNTTLACPSCKVMRGASTKAPREEPLPQLAGIAAQGFLAGGDISEYERLAEKE